MTNISTEPDVNGHDGCSIAQADRHRVLADDRRRVLLDVLGDRQLPVGLQELAAEVAAAEDGPDHRRVGLTLHHAHLPLLADVGVVDYDRERNRVTACRYTLEELRP